MRIFDVVEVYHPLLSLSIMLGLNKRYFLFTKIRFSFKVLSVHYHTLVLGARAVLVGLAF